MATAVPELSLARCWPAALLWVAVGGCVFSHWPPDGSAGLVLGLMWAALLSVRWLPWARWGLAAPPIAGLCCPAPQPRITDVAMGWMMGTLWWHADSCLGVRVPLLLWVAGHLGGMVLLLWFARGLFRFVAQTQRQSIAVGAAVLAFAIAWAGPVGASSTLAVMGLLTLSWAVEPVQHVPSPSATARWAMLLVGPLGLWLILAQWPTRGPDALWLALMGLTAGRVLLGCARRLRMLFVTAPLVFQPEQH